MPCDYLQGVITSNVFVLGFGIEDSVEGVSVLAFPAHDVSFSCPV